jgi:hypothetical protein
MPYIYQSIRHHAVFKFTKQHGGYRFSNIPPSHVWCLKNCITPLYVVSYNAVAAVRKRAQHHQTLRRQLYYKLHRTLTFITRLYRVLYSNMADARKRLNINQTPQRYKLYHTERCHWLHRFLFFSVHITSTIVSIPLCTLMNYIKLHGGAISKIPNCISFRNCRKYITSYVAPSLQYYNLHLTHTLTHCTIARAHTNRTSFPSR